MQLKRKINSLEDLLEYVDVYGEKREITLRCAELVPLSKLVLSALYFVGGKFDELPVPSGGGDLFSLIEADHDLLKKSHDEETMDVVRSDAFEKNILTVEKEFVKFQVFDSSGDSVIVVIISWAGYGIGVGMVVNHAGLNIAGERTWIESVRYSFDGEMEYMNHDLGYPHSWEITLKSFRERFNEMMKPFGVVEFFKNEN